MNDNTHTFNRLRPRLQGIAYRMLGSWAEAEEVVQDAWLRWHEADPNLLDNTEAWLVSVTARLAIDRLRSAKIQRAHYVGTWLPEPLLSDSPVSPEQILERADDVMGSTLCAFTRSAIRTSLRASRGNGAVISAPPTHQLQPREPVSLP